MRCEDYPCCGHGPAPWGDGGGCPDEEGRFRCVTCGATMPRGSHSSICDACHRDPRTFHDPDCPGCPTCDPGPYFECQNCGEGPIDPDDPCPECGW